MLTPGASPRSRGLSAAEVAERVRLGRTNAEGAPTSRSVGEIVRRNVFTFFNGLLLVLLIAILVFGDLRDALFGFVLFLNMAIGIIQELRAKATLDRLSVLAAPRVTVVRDGAPAEIAVAAVVMDDVIELRRGDQVVADGEVLESGGLEIDESLLTGESRPVLKKVGERVMSGSFCVAGSGRMQADGVGAASYAQRLAAEARRFKRVPSELRRTTDLILKTIAVALVPVGILLAATRWAKAPVLGIVVPETVSGLVGMIPQGLVLLTSIAFAVSVIKLARRRALIEELPAVEVLARVDVVCLDKTGTLTEPTLEVAAFEVLEGAGNEPEARAALAALAAAEPPAARNATALALADAFPLAGDAPASAVPFSSSRKWSAVTLADGSSWFLGAPDQLLPEGNAARIRANALQATGVRVVLLGRSDEVPSEDRPYAVMTTVALVSLEERIRDDAADALAYLSREGVALKVISGDAPVTVAAVARRCGLEIVGEPVDASMLPKDPEALADFMEAHDIFGRVRPEDKRDMVVAMQSRGHVVAMTGDGVNDVLALKSADLGIAMGAGAPAARAVADLVLLDGKFSTFPDVLAEGRRVMANVERVAALFVTKSVYAALLAVGAGLLVANYPLLPRHFTLIDAITIGIPGFFLALSPAAPRYRSGMMRRVLRFAVACGLAMTAMGAAAFAWALRVPGASLSGGVAEARTVTVWTLVFTGLWVLFELSRPVTRGRVVLIVAMLASALLVMFVPFARTFFALPPAPTGSTLVVAGATAVAAVLIEIVLRLAGWRPGERERAKA